MAALPRHVLLLIGFLLVQGIQVSLSAIENVSRGKNTTQTWTYVNGTSDLAVDGNYDQADLQQCATLLSPRATRTSPGNVMWEVDLEDLYAIASVTIYNTAVLPEGTFMRHARVCAQHRRSGVARGQFCVTIQPHRENYMYFRLRPGGKVVVHFNQLVVANAVVISKSGFMTLCEVDVLGTKVEMTPDEDVSTGKTARQSGTVAERSADYAVDGNSNNGTDPGTCAAAYVFHDGLLSTAYGLPAWWQVNLGDFYLVKAITVYFPTTGLDRLYTSYFNALVSFNDSLPPYYSYGGPGSCYTKKQRVSRGPTTLNCTRAFGYLLTVGRYVTVMPYASWFLPSESWASVLTICEVTVIGVRQSISADDPALAVFSPKPASSAVSLEFILSISAICIAGLFAIICIIFIIIVVIKLRGRTRSSEASESTSTTRRNAYQDARPKKQKQTRSKVQEEPPPEQPVYSDNVDEDTEAYEYIDIDNAHGQRPHLPPKKRF